MTFGNWLCPWSPGQVPRGPRERHRERRFLWRVAFRRDDGVAPAGTDITALVRVEGHRGAIEDFETAKTTRPTPGIAGAARVRLLCSPLP